LPKPFFVVATQNPLDLAGTFPLPDSQLDRFMLRLSLDYPDPAAERALLIGEDRRDMMASLKPRLDATAIAQLHAAAQAVKVSSTLLDYLQALLTASRKHNEVRVGLSPRAGLALLAASRAWAMISGRDFVIPEDVQTVFVPTAAHRLVPGRGSHREAIARAILAETAVP
jgi:MoxR-like ATPase